MARTPTRFMCGIRKSQEKGWVYLSGDGYTATSIRHENAQEGHSYYAARAETNSGGYSAWSSYLRVDIAAAAATATSTATATPTVVSKATLTPTPTPTASTATSCNLVSRNGGRQGTLPTNSPLIRDATRQAYESQYGERIESLFIVSVDWRADGRVEIQYLTGDSPVRTVSELFRGC